MYTDLKAKCQQNAELMKFILYTGNKSFVEANQTDTYWSCGIDIKDEKKILDRANWPSIEG